MRHEVWGTIKHKNHHSIKKYEEVDYFFRKITFLTVHLL